MDHIQKIKAGELALALSWGYAELSEAVDWADGQIPSTDTPDDRLFDVSLAKSTADAMRYLNNISEGADSWDTVSHFLTRFYSLTTMSSEEASNLARSLNLLVLENEEVTPALFNGFFSHWDSIRDAIAGVYGDPNECVQDFLKDIRKVVDAKFAKFNISWSIYVRCLNHQKFTQTHLPAIEQLIGTPELGWVISSEPHNPDEIRASAFVEFDASSKEDAVILSLKWANKLYAGTWNVSGLSTLNGDEPLCLFAIMYTDKPSPTAPALTTVQIEVGERKTTGRTGDC